MDPYRIRKINTDSDAIRKVRELEEFRKFVDGKMMEACGIPQDYFDKLSEAQVAINKLKRRQSLESLGRWVIAKCLQSTGE